MVELLKKGYLVNLSEPSRTWSVRNAGVDFRYISVYPFVTGILAVFQLSDNRQVLLPGKAVGQHIILDLSSIIPVGCQCRVDRLLQLAEYICGMIRRW